jgi:hypothetical protein
MIEVPIVIIAEGPGSGSMKDSDLQAEVGHQAASIASLAPLGRKHLQYILLNDSSKTNQWPGGIKQQTDVVDTFLKEVIVPGSDVGSLVNFNEQTYIDIQDETDPKKLRAKLQRTGSGRTALYDTVLRSTLYLAQQPADPKKRKVLFLFSDGDDNASEVNIEQLTEACAKAGIPIFIFAPSSVETTTQGGRLRRLASRSGGRVYFLGVWRKRGSLGFLTAWLPRSAKRVKFKSLKQDLAQSFLLKVSVPMPPNIKLEPLKVTNISSPGVIITAPSSVIIPREFPPASR